MSVVNLMSEVARRELAAHRSLSMGVVTEVFSNDGGSGEHHLDCHVRLHGSGLVLQNVAVAVSRVGISAMPRVDDLVVLGFIDADVNGAIILGVIHAQGMASPDAAPNEVIYEVPDSDGGERRFEMRLPNGNTLTVNDGSVEIVMGGTSMKIEADGAITIEAAGDITLKSQGSLTLEAATSATLKAGTSATVEGSSSAKLKGAQTTIAGITSFSAG